jgi:hypothetical protein
MDRLYCESYNHNQKSRYCSDEYGLLNVLRAIRNLELLEVEIENDTRTDWSEWQIFDAVHRASNHRGHTEGYIGGPTNNSLLEHASGLNLRE